MAINKDIVILLVEDAGVMRSMEKKTLKEIGFNRILEAKDGEDAVNTINKASHIDLVISDWNMPNKNGLELLQWIRLHKDYKSIPFIMATGRGEKKEINRAEKEGANSFITKPFNADELIQKIEEAFNEPGSGEEIEEWQPQLSDSGKVILRMGHIQITDHLVLGVLKHMIENGNIEPKYFELDTACMSSWNPVSRGLEHGTIDGACVLAPIAMDLFAYDVPLKLILFAHKNGSIFVRNNRGGTYEKPYQNFFKDKSFYIPHLLSIHHILAHMFFDNIGLNAGMAGDEGTDVRFEVVPPIQMPELISKNSDACGYLVAEPLGTKAITSGDASLQFFSKELWDDHPCCVVTLRQEFIDYYPDAVYEFTDYLVQCGQFITEKPALAAEIGVKFLDPDGTLGLTQDIIKNVLTEPLGITTDDLYPVVEDLERIQHYMHDQMDIGKIIDVDEFVDLRFAEQACIKENGMLKNGGGHSSGEKAMDLLSARAEQSEIEKYRQEITVDGKYLTFGLQDQVFGINILQIREILQYTPMRKIPRSDNILMGIINLRGRIIPVIDLRLALELETKEYDTTCRIIVLEFESLQKSIQIGVVVDKVIAVADITREDIQESPEFGIQIRMDYIQAFAKINEEITILLDIEEIMSQKQKQELSRVAHAETA